MDLIYINGDSYSAKTYHPVYSQFLQDQFNVAVVNKAIPGSNNNRIFRSSLEDLIKLKDKNVVAIIGVSFVARDEVWYEGTDLFILNKIPDKSDNSHSRLITLDWLIREKGGWGPYKELIEDLNINRQLSHFYTNLFTFAHTLENLGISYIIFSAADNSDWQKASWDYLNSLSIK